MIDPDNIQITKINLPDIIKVKDIPEFETQVYNLEDEKDYRNYIKNLKNEVRKSFEYRQFIKYLREYMGMNKCAFLKNVSNEETFDIKIEIHHYPFTLEDICEVVVRKRTYYNESLELQMVAKEAMELHYKLLVGLISLSETVHQVTHSGKLFIPVTNVLGRYNLFIDLYKPFCKPEHLEAIDRMEKYTIENSEILDTTIIEQNKVNYKVVGENNRFALPEFNQITDNMIQQIEAIKNNNYLLPDVNTVNMLEEKKEIIIPIEFDETLIKK